MTDPQQRDDRGSDRTASGETEDDEDAADEFEFPEPGGLRGLVE